MKYSAFNYTLRKTFKYLELTIHLYIVRVSRRRDSENSDVVNNYIHTSEFEYDVLEELVSGFVRPSAVRSSTI